MNSLRLNWFTCCLALPLFASTCCAQSNPVPFMSQPLVPAAVVPGGPGFSFTIHGAGFVPGSIAYWNGTPLATQFLNAGKLTAVVPAADVSTARTVNVTVVSPGPGGGSSNAVPFLVVAPTTSLQFKTSAVAGATSPINLVTADFNHDGLADLAVIDGASGSCNYQEAVGSIAIFLGNGNGTFTKHSTLCIDDLRTEVPLRLAVAGDLNRDGNVDLVAAENTDQFGDQLITYYGNGDGTFTRTPPSAQARAAAKAAVAEAPTTSYPHIQGLALGDFESNGQLDIAESEFDDYGFSDIYLLPANYTLLSAPITGSGPLSGGDFNGDGVLDLAEGSTALKMFLSAGNGQFSELPDVPFGSGESVVSGDFNGDGILDAVATNGNSLSVLLGNGDGTFSQKSGQPTSAQTNVDLIAADFNGDGILDVAVTDSTNVVSIWRGNGDGTFQAPVDTSGRGDGIVAADFTGDGRIDLAVTDSVAQTVTVLLQSVAAAAPTFSVPSGSYPSGTPVTLSTTTPGCSSSIYWGTGNPPANHSTSFSVLANTTIYAYVHGCAGFADSKVVSESFMVYSSAAAPIFSLPSGSYRSGTAVTLSTATPGCSSFIYWGTNNPPTNHSTSFSVLANATIYAYVHGCTGFADSKVVSETFSVKK